MVGKRYIHKINYNWVGLTNWINDADYAVDISKEGGVKKSEIEKKLLALVKNVFLKNLNSSLLLHFLDCLSAIRLPLVRW